MSFESELDGKRGGKAPGEEGGGVEGEETIGTKGPELDFGCYAGDRT